MTVSHWRHSLASTTPIPCDALVIGAGICGVSAALAFQRRGLRVHTVERHHLAAGASSRNAGFLMRGAADHYADACALYGRDRARLVWKWTEDNLTGLRAEGIESLPSYRPVPSCLLALHDTQADELKRSAQLLQEDGFDAPWIETGDDTPWRTGRVRGGLLNPHDASVNPLELLRHLAAKLTTPIHENEEVFDIAPVSRATGSSAALSGQPVPFKSPAVSVAPEPSPTSPLGHLATPPLPLLVRTSSLTFLTPRVLVCTNAYAPLLFPSLAGFITPRRGQMLAIANADRKITLNYSYYANHGSEYFRQTSDGSIVVGGCRTSFADRERGYDDTTTGYVQTAIERFAAEVFGNDWDRASDAGRITARWSGTMGFSPDGLPLVGPIPDPVPPPGGSEPGGAPRAETRPSKIASSIAPRLWFCGAFTGHGMSMAYRTAHAAADAMLDGTPTPFPIDRPFTPPPLV